MAWYPLRPMKGFGLAGWGVRVWVGGRVPVGLAGAVRWPPCGRAEGLQAEPERAFVAVSLMKQSQNFHKNGTWFVFSFFIFCNTAT